MTAQPPQWPLWAVRHEDTLTWVEAPNATTAGAFAADRLALLDPHHTVTLEVFDPDAPDDERRPVHVTVTPHRDPPSP